MKWPNTALEPMATDEEILQWCFKHGRRPNEEEILVWNSFMTKRGWKDDSTEELNIYKNESGLANKDEIQTFFDHYDYDEGRKE
jgi:gluconokinase